MFTVQVSMKKPKKPKRLLLLVLVPVAAGCLCAACFHQGHVPQNTATLNGKAYTLSVKDGNLVWTDAHEKTSITFVRDES